MVPIRPSSATIRPSQLRELDRVTLHREFEVSPLEIGGLGAVPPSPPHINPGDFGHLGFLLCGMHFGSHCAAAAR